jgi:putative DNA primase/helicase
MTAPIRNPDPTATPSELIALPQWVCWRYETRGGKTTKAPIDAKSNGHLAYAKTNDPATWASHAEALAACGRHPELAGIGFCFAPDDGLTGIDLDHVIDPDTGELEPEAAGILERFKDTYIEVSPSGTGLRLFCYGRPGRSGKNVGRVKWCEVYSHPSSRYLTVTGNHWTGSATAVTEQQAALDWLHGKFMVSTGQEPVASKPGPLVALTLDDAALLDKARSAKNGTDFERLWSGDTSGHGGDDSAADLALCSLLAFWTGNDADRIDRLFRQSGLFRPKWDSRRGEAGTYGSMTVDKAVAGCKEFYGDRQGVRSEAPAHTPKPTALPPLICEHKGEMRLTSQQKAAGILAKMQEFEQIRYHAIHNDFYHYDKAAGIFERKPALISESAVYRAIRKYSDDFPFSAAYVSGVTKCLTWETATDFEPLKNHIGFKNGVLRLSDKKLFPHDPSFGLTSVLPYDWLPDAPEPTAVIEWLLDAVSGHPDRVQVLRAVINACITGRADLQRFIELIGPGGSGKGTFIRLVTALVGFLAVHSTDLKSLEGNRFESAKIFGKKVVVITDAERWHGDVSMLKAITGQDRIRFEEKHKQAGESFEFAGMVIIAGNQHTESTDYSSGIQRRRVTIPFEHVVPAHQRRDLDAEFEPLLPAVAVWALAMPRDDVTNFLRNTDNAARSLYAAKLDALAATNTVAAWLLDNVVFDESAKTKVGSKKKVTRHGMSESRVEYEHADEWLYPNFAAWCEGNGKNPVAHNVFSRTAIEIANTTLGRGFVRKAISGNGAHIEGLRLRRDEELVRSHEELVRNSLPNSEVYSIENYELSKNEELLDIYTDFPYSQADNNAASKSCEENQESFKESLRVPHVHNFQSVSPHKFLTSSSQSSSQVRNSPRPGPDISADIAIASPPESPSTTTTTCKAKTPDISRADPRRSAPPVCLPSTGYPFRYVTKCDKPTPIMPESGYGDPVGCSHCGAMWGARP